MAAEDRVAQEVAQLHRVRAPIFRLRDIQDDTRADTRDDGSSDPLYFAAGPPLAREINGAFFSPILRRADIDIARKAWAQYPSIRMIILLAVIWVVGAVNLTIALGVPIGTMGHVLLGLVTGTIFAFALARLLLRRYRQHCATVLQSIWDRTEHVPVPAAFTSDAAWETADQYF